MFSVLLVGLILIAGVVMINLARPYSGAVYSCAPLSPPDCAKQPLVGTEVYLLSVPDDLSSPGTVLQVTRSDAGGRYWFFSAPPGAVGVVRVGNYRPDTWTGPHAEQPYCAFAAQWMPSHDIEILRDDVQSAIIGDFGGFPNSLTICPQALR
jgi:hypothetical protein